MFAKYLQDHQKILLVVNPFLVNKVKELDDNSIKKNKFKGSEDNSKAGCRWKIFDSIHTRKYLCRDKKFGVQS